jgi:hypothetical protein
MFKKILLLLALLVPATVSYAIGEYDERIMARGDANNDSSVDMSDALYINAYFYQGGPVPPCKNQADANDDGVLDGSDSIFILIWFFNNGAPPPAPGPYTHTCTTDDYPYPGCDTDPC